MYKMSSSYTFENMSRIGNDSCCIEQNTIQSMQHCNYMLQNYFSNDCSMKNPIALATSQPCINYKGGFQVGAGGCNIQESSNLQIGTIQTHPRCRINLFHRPFATVPYLGRGAVDPIAEAQLQQGETITSKKSVTQQGDVSYLGYHMTPLIPDVQDRMTNPIYSVEGAAAEGWIRGGIPSRDLTRDIDFFNDSKSSKTYS